MQSTLNVNDYFETSDLPLVAALCSFGIKIEAVEHNGTRRAVFYIRRKKGLDGLIQGFWAHELRVDPLLYFNALKEAKTRLYETQNY